MAGIHSGRRDGMDLIRAVKDSGEASRKKDWHG